MMSRRGLNVTANHHVSVAWPLTDSVLSANASLVWLCLRRWSPKGERELNSFLSRAVLVVARGRTCSWQVFRLGRGI